MLCLANTHLAHPLYATLAEISTKTASYLRGLAVNEEAASRAQDKSNFSVGKEVSPATAVTMAVINRCLIMQASWRRTCNSNRWNVPGGLGDYK